MFQILWDKLISTYNIKFIKTEFFYLKTKTLKSLKLYFVKFRFRNLQFKDLVYNLVRYRFIRNENIIKIQFILKLVSFGKKHLIIAISVIFLMILMIFSIKLIILFMLHIIIINLLVINCSVTDKVFYQCGYSQCRWYRFQLCLQ